MITRSAQFYDFVSQGLAAMGYTDAQGNVDMTAYLNDMFAEKYNADKTYTQVGFPLNPDITINPTYAQIEATIRPYTLAANVDYDSDGPTKSLDGINLRSGQLPTFKHEVYLSRKVYRDKMQIANLIGKATDDILDVVMDLFFTSVDDLLGGNYNTMLYLRHQIVSNQGKLVIDSNNNPWGLPLEIDFGVDKKHIHDSAWYKKDAATGTVTQTDNVNNGKISPIQVARKIVQDAKDKDFAPAMHWECSYQTYLALVDLPYFREQYVLATRPDISDSDMRVAFGNTIEENVIWNYIQSRIGTIKVFDAVASVESVDKTTHKPVYNSLQSFKEGVLALVPDGNIGDVQFGKPVFIDTPGARNALYDGGRTLLRTIFQDDKMNYAVKSEFQGIPVPNKTRWFYYLNVMG